MESSLRDKRVAHSQDLRNALQLVLEKLSAKSEVRKIILIGSYASGRVDLFTDLDLLVVMDTDQDFISRLSQLYPEFDTGIDLDLLVYTPEEFELMKRRPFIKHALREGKVLYEK
jgi:predicted nucleotidyltransferase